jgi:ribosomal protein S18 acetylase RimI-like enzyme
MNMSINYVIKELSENDIDDYRNIRLDLLLNESESFGSSYEEESLFGDEMWISRLAKNNVHTIGAYLDKEIIGIIVLVLNVRRKMKHIANINSMYVKPLYRNKGLAFDLLNFAENIALSKGVERLNLSVVESNLIAFNLYKKCGFKEYGIEPDTIKIDDKYFSLRLMSKVIKKG